MKNQAITFYRGFSLIEMMIVLAILVILASVAYPSYIQHIDRERRTEAQSILWLVASQQERFYTTNYRYATPLELGADPANNIQNENNTYNVTSVYPNGNTTFQLTATPLGWADNDCGVFTLFSNGTKWVSGNPDGDGSDGDAGDGVDGFGNPDVADPDDIAACWR